MKIILPSLKIFNNCNIRSNKTNQEIKSQDSKTNISDYPISFGNNTLTISLINDLKNLKNVPCPCCGAKMLSSKESEFLYKQIEKIKTGKDILTFLNEIKDNINPFFKTFVENISNIANENPEKDSDSIFEKLNTLCQKNTDDELTNLKLKLQKLIDSDEFDKVQKERLSGLLYKFQVLPHDVKRKNLYKHISKSMRETLENFDNRGGKSIYNKLNGDIKKAFIFEYLFSELDDNSKPLTTIFFKNFLGYSNSVIRKVFQENPATPENLILSCNYCTKSNKNFTNPNSEHKFYYEYIYTLANKALNGELSIKDYPLKLKNLIKKLSKTGITPDNTQKDLRLLIEDLGYTSARRLDFQLVNLSGIYCSSCGQKTISHKEKEILYEKIKNTSSIPEILEIFEENKDIIKHKHSEVIKLLKKEFLANPHISELELLDILRNQTFENIENILQKGINKLDKITEHKTLTSQQQTAINSYKKKVRELRESSSKDSLFKYNEYRTLFINLVDSFDGDRTMRGILWIKIFNPLAQEFYTSIPLYPLPEVIQKVGSPLKVMAQDIFSRATATIDHLESQSKYEHELRDEPVIYTQNVKNKLSNLTVMCKDCNNNKGSRSLKKWLNQTPGMVKNLQKYLAQIKRMEEEGLIDKSYKFYVNGVKAHFYKLTGINLFE